MMNKKIIILIVLFSISNFVIAGEIYTSEKHSFSIEIVVDGLEYPWSIEFIPDGGILIAERPGRLRIFENGKLSKPIKGLPNIKVKGQGGLLDIALDPDFSNNKTLYFSYSAGNLFGIGTEVASAKLINDELKELKLLFKALPKSMGERHFGSRLLLTSDDSLYITLGDRGEKERAQDINDHAGSLIRINKDGSIPKNNPFVRRSDAKAGIYTYGNRNIQGIALHPITGEVWTIEHGPQGGDELNLMKSGVNYGWPVITYGVNYGSGSQIGEGTHKNGMAQPIYYWIPSIATSSLLFYDGEKFPYWKGNIFVSSLKFGQLARLEMTKNKVISEERLINGVFGRIREVKEGPDGFLYILTDDTNGKLIRMKPINK
jgi:glucose/arabinose dehydrogenase